jgi:hypothetical protein
MARISALYAAAAMAAAAAASTAAAAATPALPTFEQWAAARGRVYASPEAERRARAAFAANAAFVAAHNADGNRRSYTVGLTRFADLTPAEFAAAHLSGAPPLPGAHGEAPAPAWAGPLPTSVDWAAKGLVSPVKNVQCSAVVDEFTGAVESGAAIAAGGALKPIDEDQLSCAGCGCTCQPANVCKWAVSHGMTYSYTAGKCSFTPDVKVASCAAVPANNESALMGAIAAAPVVVAVEADSQVFMLYTGGVLTDASCGINVNHVLLATGYGTTGGQDYYAARNAWGTDWGQAGYIWLGRGPAKGPGECGVQSYAFYPVVKTN